MWFFPFNDANIAMEDICMSLVEGTCSEAMLVTTRNYQVVSKYRIVAAVLPFIESIRRMKEGHKEKKDDVNDQQSHVVTVAAKESSYSSEKRARAKKARASLETIDTPTIDDYVRPF